MRLLGDGSQWGLTFTFLVQPEPEGLAQAYLLAEAFLDGAPSAMVLGDNIFFGEGLTGLLLDADRQSQGGTVFVSTAWTAQLEYVPTRFYPYDFVVDVEGREQRFTGLAPR